MLSLTFPEILVLVSSFSHNKVLNCPHFEGEHIQRLRSRSISLKNFRNTSFCFSAARTRCNQYLVPRLASVLVDRRRKEIFRTWYDKITESLLEQRVINQILTSYHDTCDLTHAFSTLVGVKELQCSLGDRCTCFSSLDEVSGSVTPTVHRDDVS